MSVIDTKTDECTVIQFDQRDQIDSLYTDFNDAMSKSCDLPQKSEKRDDSYRNEDNKKPNRKDWIDEENPLHCKPCNFKAKDVKDFQDHSLSYKHIKKTAEVLEMKINAKKEEDKKKPPMVFNCEVCSCTCNSESAWNSHLLGGKHRKNLEKQGAEKQLRKQKMKFGGSVPGPIFNFNHQQKKKPYQKMPRQPEASTSHCANDFLQYKEPLIGLEYVTEIQVSGQNPRYHCKLCDAKFDHNVKFPHLVGTKHRYNVLNKFKLTKRIIEKNTDPFLWKEKNPTAAQGLRVGIKKRSELTGKLLEEARKIEKEEGRQSVKTCVEASPFKTVPPPLMDTKSGTSTSQSCGRARGRGQQQFQGRGRGTLTSRGRSRWNASVHGQTNRRSGSHQHYQSFREGYQGSQQSHCNPSPLMGGYSQQTIGLNEKQGEFIQQISGINQQLSGFNQHPEGYNQLPRSFNQQPGGFIQHPNGTNPQSVTFSQHPSGSIKYSGGFSPRTGRFNQKNKRSNFSSNNQKQFSPQQNFKSLFSGWQSDGMQQQQLTLGAVHNPEQQPPFVGDQQYFQPSSIEKPLLPKEEFCPRSHPNNNAGQRITHTASSTWTCDTNPQEMEPTKSSESPEELNKGNILQNLSDLGKLVNSEEDASLALQVSNALTQALLNYRMQNLE